MSAALAFRAASIDITPPWPVALVSGEGHCRTPFTAIEDRLECNIVVLEQAAARVAIVQLDCLVVGEALRAAVRERSGLREDELFICASHTHFGPGTDASQPNLGPVDARYVEWLSRRVGDALAGLLERPGRAARLRYGTRELPGTVINRRLRRWRVSRRAPFVTRGVIGGPNPGGPADSTLRVLAVEALEGGASAILWNFACHPVCFPHADRVSAEYPGVVRQALRERPDGAPPVVFLNGFAGDVRPAATRRGEAGVVQMLREAFAGPRFVRWGESEWRGWADGIARGAAAALECASEVPDPRLAVRRAAMPLSELAAGAPQGRTVSFHRVTLGEDLAIVGVSAEPLAGYTRRVAAELGIARLIPVAYIDGVFGYLPDEKALREGGYEASGGAGSYVPPGRFHEDVSARALRGFRSVAA